MPDAIGLSLDSQGWVSVELIAKSHAAGNRFTRADRLYVVETSDKKRFSLSAWDSGCAGTLRRSRSGTHSERTPALLDHGTPTRFVASILVEGLKPKSRQQVHLSADEVTA